MGSQSSMNTQLGASIHRVNSVTNVLRKLFSRENSRTDGREREDGIPMSVSAANLNPKNYGGGSMKITDQVIEEVMKNQITKFQDQLF